MTAPADNRASFNLIDEPWIQVLLHDGTVTELSLRAIFERAEEVREVVGEVPTQVFAVNRLLLAILYRAVDEGIEDTAGWKSLWTRGLPVAEILEYLEEFRGRFDLLHPQEPFFQVADLATSKGEIKDIAQLIFDLPANNRLFTMRAGAGLDSLSLAEAARWLVHTQAYNASGIKSGAVGDARVKGGRGYPIGVAWAGLLGGVLIEGDNLRDTLLLNLVPAAEWGGFSGSDLPPWERPQLTAAAEGPRFGEPLSPGAEGREPRGPVDLYTWQSRRIRLFINGDRITGSLVSNGDKLTPQNRHRYELMTAWRRSNPQEKKLGLPLVYMPREHNPSRAFWRGLSALIPSRSQQDGVVQGQADAASSLPPATIQWLSRLQMLGVLTGTEPVKLRAIGVLYGSQSSVVSELIDDRLVVSLALLRERSEPLAHHAEAAVALADASVLALKNLAGDLAAAGGGEGEGPRERAEEATYAALDPLFRGWLAALSPGDDPAAALSAWREQVFLLVDRRAEALIAAAGPQAWTGRIVRDRLLNSPLAEARFNRDLGKALGASITGKDVA